MKRLSIVVIILCIIIVASLLWWNRGIQAANPNDTSSRIFVVQKGDGMREITNKLKTEGLIQDPVVFFLLVKNLGLDGKIQAGDFRFSPSMTAQQITEGLTHGTLDIWVTIPEGKRAEEIADILKEKMPTYQPLWRLELKTNEGYLFPDTYLFPKESDIKLIMTMMMKNFKDKFSQIKITNKNTLSKNDMVIVASMIEREAKFPEDRPLVASVLLNRLNLGMKLDVDATIQYALGYQEADKRWWKKELTREDLNLDSSYNTYKHAGLPPTPIANPGADAIKAVANPAETDYLYYISDKTGHNHYAKTLEEQNANIKKYGL